MNVAPAMRPVVPPAAAGARPAIECRGIWKLYGERRQLAKAAAAALPETTREELRQRFDVFAAVAGVDLTIERHEILCLVGLSGSGKSTLLRHLNRLVEATRGEILVDGTDLATLSPRALRELRRSGVGMVAQQTSLFPHRSVIDNVAYGLEIRGLPRGERYAAARKWLQRMQLGDWEARYPDELSGGMQQRVGLARTMVNEPEILLLDEPFSALDPIIRNELQGQFVTLFRDLRKTAVFITHDFGEAIRMADRIGVMKDGKLVQLGRPRDILLNPSSDYVAAFARDTDRAQYVTVGDVMEMLPADGTAATALVEPIATIAPLAQVMALLAEQDLVLPVHDEEGIVGTVTRGTLLRFFRDNAPGRGEGWR